MIEQLSTPTWSQHDLSFALTRLQHFIESVIGRAEKSPIWWKERRASNSPCSFFGSECSLLSGWPVLEQIALDMCVNWMPVVFCGLQCHVAHSSVFSNYLFGQPSFVCVCLSCSESCQVCVQADSYHILGGKLNSGSNYFSIAKKIRSDMESFLKACSFSLVSGQFPQFSSSDFRNGKEWKRQFNQIRLFAATKLSSWESWKAPLLSIESH